MSTKVRKIAVRKHGNYFQLVSMTGRKPISEMKDLIKRRQARVDRCKEALKVAAKEGDMGRVRQIKAHLQWATERLALALSRKKKAAAAA